MTETTLHAQFELFRPFKSLLMIEEAVTSTNDGVVKLAYIKYSELRHAVKALRNATIHTNPSRAATTTAPTSQKKRKPSKSKRGAPHAPHKLHQASKQEKDGRQKLNQILQQAVQWHHGETTVHPDEGESPTFDSPAPPQDLARLCHHRA